jgi:hypothetical protein
VSACRPSSARKTASTPSVANARKSNRQESERLASDRREKDQLEAERQRHLKATGSGSEPQLEAKAKRSAVPPGEHWSVSLAQKWSFAPFALALIVCFFWPGRHFGRFAIFVPIVLLCLHFFFPRNGFLQLLFSLIGFIAFLVITGGVERGALRGPSERFSYIRDVCKAGFSGLVSWKVTSGDCRMRLDQIVWPTREPAANQGARFGLRKYSSPAEVDGCVATL